MSQRALIADPQPAAPDEEVVDTLRTAIARGGRLPRSADMLLCGIAAEHLLAELHGAGLDVVRRMTRD